MDFIGYSLIIDMGECNVCFFDSDVYKVHDWKLQEAGSAHPGCMGTRLQSGSYPDTTHELQNVKG